MKYRIVKYKTNEYGVQFKRLFFWWNYCEPIVIEGNRLITIGTAMNSVSFKNKDLAESKIKILKSLTKYRGHRIIHIRDLYVDVSTRDAKYNDVYRHYSPILKEVKDMIDNVIYLKERERDRKIIIEKYPLIK